MNSIRQILSTEEKVETQISTHKNKLQLKLEKLQKAQFDEFNEFKDSTMKSLNEKLLLEQKKILSYHEDLFNEACKKNKSISFTSRRESLKLEIAKEVLEK